jgi:ParB-like chromosome segregation protein Spo0J
MTPQGPQAVMPGVKLTEAPSFPDAPAQARQGADGGTLTLDVQTDKTPEADRNVQRFAGQQDMDLSGAAPTTPDVEAPPPAGDIVRIRRDQIDLDPETFQPRDKDTGNPTGLNMDRVQQIADEWNPNELLPLQVWPNPDRPGRYVLAHGHHRLAAGDIRGVKEFPAIVIKGDKDAAIRVSELAGMTEPLKPAEVAGLLQRQIDRGLSVEEAARALRLKVPQAKLLLPLQHLPPTLRRMVNTGQLDERKASAVGKAIGDGVFNAHDAERFVLDILGERDYSVTAVNDIIKGIASAGETAAAPATPQAGLFDSMGSLDFGSASGVDAVQQLADLGKLERELTTEKSKFTGVGKSKRSSAAMKAEAERVAEEIKAEIKQAKIKMGLNPVAFAILPENRAVKAYNLYSAPETVGYGLVTPGMIDPSTAFGKTVGEEMLAVANKTFQTGETYYAYADGRRIAHMLNGATHEEAVELALRDWHEKLRLERGIGKKKTGSWRKTGGLLRLLLIDLPRDIILYNNVRGLARILMQQVGNTFQMIAHNDYVPALANLSPVQTVKALTRGEIMTPEMTRIATAQGWYKPLAESVVHDQVTGSGALAPQRLLEALKIPGGAKSPASLLGNLVANKHVRDMANAQDNWARHHLATHFIKKELIHAKQGLIDAGHLYARNNLTRNPLAGDTIERAINDLWKKNGRRGMDPAELQRVVTAALDAQFGPSPRHFNAGVRISRDWDNASRRTLVAARDKNRTVLFSGPATNADQILSNMLLFNFFFARQTKFMLRQMVRNPGMARAVMAANQSDWAEARRRGAPDWLQNFIKVMDKYGIELWANPVGLVGTYIFFRYQAPSEDERNWVPAART